jgi:hypothetical protein
LSRAKPLISTERVVEAGDAHRLADVAIQLDLGQQLLRRHRGALHLKHCLGNVEMPDMHLGQHIGQQPSTIHRDEGAAAVALFESVKQTFVDLALVELVDFLVGKQGVVVKQTVAIYLVEAMALCKAAANSRGFCLLSN